MRAASFLGGHPQPKHSLSLNPGPKVPKFAAFFWFAKFPPPKNYMAFFDEKNVDMDEMDGSRKLKKSDLMTQVPLCRSLFNQVPRM